MAKRPDQRRFRDLTVQSLFRQNSKVEQVEQILREHDFGAFSRSATLCDEVMTDDRIMGTTNTRLGAQIAAPFQVNAAGESADQVKWQELVGGVNGQGGKWPVIASKQALAQIEFWGLYLGIAVAELAWEGTPTEWIPRLVPWHPQHLRWDDYLRRFMLNTREGQIALPRPDEEPRCDGKWFVWCPYGVQYGWRRGLIRAMAFKYISRNWTERDWDRYNEMRAMGLIKALVPGGAKPEDTTPFFDDLENMGSEPVIQCPQGATKDQPGYDVQAVEFMSRNWETMKERKADLNVDIAVLVLGQNLSTEVQGGSLAAAKSHELVRIDKAIEDAEIGPAIRMQVLTHLVQFNGGDPDDAPYPCFEVQPPEDDKAAAQAVLFLGQGAQALKQAEPRTDVQTMLEAEGIPMLSEEEFAAQEAEKAEKAAAAAAAMGSRPNPNDPNGGGAGGGGEPADPNGGDDQEPKPTKLHKLSGVVQRCKFMGLDIAIEHPVGSIRLWTADDGKTTGATKMALDYGFIEGHLSGDGEELDCYLGANPNADTVYVIHQRKAPDYRAHDEDKVMLGFDSADDAMLGYLVHRDDGERAFGTMSVFPLKTFVSRLRRRGSESTGKIRASAADTTSALVALVARARGSQKLARTVAGKKRTAKYQETLISTATQRAAAALAPFLTGLKAEIDGATSFAQLRKSIVRHLKQSKADASKLALVIKRTNILANLSGQASATEEV